MATDPSRDLREGATASTTRAATGAARGGASCSRSIAPLEYALLMMIEGAVRLCARCKPHFDPAGFGMHVDYAANMSAHLGGQRAFNDGLPWAQRVSERDDPANSRWAYQPLSGATPRFWSVGYLLADDWILVRAADPRSTPHWSAKPTR